MISKKIAIDVLNEALSTGADYAEIYVEHSKNYRVSCENNKIDQSGNSDITGAGLRLLKENRSIYGYTADVSKKGLLKLADSLKKSLQGERVLSVNKLVKTKYKNRSPVKKSYFDLPKDDMVRLVKLGAEEIKSFNDPRIVRQIVGFVASRHEVSVFNSKGKYFSRTQEFARMMFMVVAMDQNGYETGYSGPGCQNDISFFSDEKVKENARETVRVALTMLTAKECPSGRMPVVIGNGWGGVLFHESCGHPLEASAISRGLSCFNGKDHELIASPLVTAIDDSTIPYAWGSVDIDDEGNLGTKRVLIKNGVLQNYMIDDFNGRRMNKEGNGACRRQNFAFNPTSRMSNTYIANGKSTKEEIIKATKLGLYAVGFNGGSVDPTTGEFNFGCSEAYIIRDGKIAEPVKGATLIGKGNEILKQIDMIANDLDMGQGMCGASSGSIRTNVGQPTLRVKDVLVGGRGGELK